MFAGVADLPLWVLAAVFVTSAAAIAACGPRLARRAAELARRTGVGEAMFGAVVLGGVTSLPGIVTSVTAAASGHPSLAVGNAVGGIAAQTVFLAVADTLYRRANLEHAAASLPNLAQGALLIALLAVPLVAMGGPAVDVFAVHPATILLFAGYAGGVRVAAAVRDAPMWTPKKTHETILDEASGSGEPLGGSARVWIRFAALAAIVGVAGFAVARSGIAASGRIGVSETVIGAYFTAIATSLPELVTAVAAVRRGALALAVGDILGGNAFDVLFLAMSDVAWRGGSLYHALATEDVFMIGMAILLTGVLLLDMLRRERHGVGNIGFESALMLAIYVGGGVLLVL